MTNQTPLILKTPLTDRWVVVTKWKKLKNGIIEAREKFDVHDQITAIIELAGTIKAAEKRKRIATEKAQRRKTDGR